MYYNSNKNNSAYYNAYKEEMETLEDYHDEFSFQKIMKIGFIILALGLLSILTIYLSNYFATTKNHPAKTSIMITNIVGGVFYGIGWIIALIGFFFTGMTLTWFAIINLAIGIILGILTFKEDIQGLEERAVFYGVMWLIAMAFPMKEVFGGFALMGWFKTYFGLMAYMYLPAAARQSD